MQLPLPLVIVNVPPEFEQAPPLENDTGFPEEPPVAATVKLDPYTADDGAAVVTVIVWLPLSAFTVSVTVGAAL